MKLLALSVRQPGASFDDIQRLQVPEVTMVWQMQQEGFLREIYFDPDRPAVTLILEAESIEAARARLAQLPMVEAGLIDFDLIKLGHYAQIQALFAKGETTDALHD